MPIVYDFTKPPLNECIFDDAFFIGRRSCVIILNSKQYKELMDSEPYEGYVKDQCDCRLIILEVIDE